MVYVVQKGAVPARLLFYRGMQLLGLYIIQCLHKMITDISIVPIGMSVLPDGEVVEDLQMNVAMIAIQPSPNALKTGR